MFLTDTNLQILYTYFLEILQFCQFNSINSKKYLTAAVFYSYFKIIAIKTPLVILNWLCILILRIVTVKMFVTLPNYKKFYINAKNDLINNLIIIEWFIDRFIVN